MIAGKVSITCAAAFVGSFFIIMSTFWSPVFSEDTPHPLEIYRVFNRPDNSYRILVLRKPETVSMPGQASDAPGVVRLVDREGRLLAQADVEMVQLADSVEWSADKVRIKFISGMKPVPEYCQLFC